MSIDKGTLEGKVIELFDEKFVQTEVKEVPDVTDKRLTHGATGLGSEFTYLYVDIRESSNLSEDHRRQTAARIYKAFHHCMVEIIKYHSGKVRSFDGDRVMGIFDGDSKVNNSIEAAMHMEGCRNDILEPLITKYYKDETFNIGIGIATGNVLIIKAGVGYDENNRDLVSVGAAANFAAKLSDIASYPKSIYICDKSLPRLTDGNRYHINTNGNKEDMWSVEEIDYAGSKVSVYYSVWFRHLPSK